jgi:ABC-type glycerol-3-phosphate transport system substrate-binding protein
VITLRAKGTFVLLALLAGPALPGCGRTGSDAAPALRGKTIEVLAGWEGTEAARFRLVLDRFERDTGAVVRYTSTGGEPIGRVLDGRLAAGRPPDVAVLPQPALVARYARAGVVRPLADGTVSAVRSGYAPVWRDLGSVDGRLYGVWFKAANKSLVWYSIGLFEQAGIVPPADLEGLLDRARLLTGRGVAPFSVAGMDDWTLTDWFENVYLRTAGPERYEDLGGGRLPWTDRSVVAALRFLARVFDPVVVAGGTAGALATSFEAAVAAMFSPDPPAAMLMEGDFVVAVANDAGPTAAELGVDVDVFPFPAGDADRTGVVGGGDAAVVLGPGPGPQALVGYLAGAEAGAVLAAAGGFVSPNEDVDLAVYPDDITRSIARQLLQAGDGFHFDLSDTQAPEFGSTPGQGMPGILAEFLADPSDAEGTATRLEGAAAAGRPVSGR